MNGNNNSTMVLSATNPISVQTSEISPIMGEDNSAIVSSIFELLFVGIPQVPDLQRRDDIISIPSQSHGKVDVNILIQI